MLSTYFGLFLKTDSKYFMPIDITPLQNKQRIIITGNRGTEKIYQLVRFVLTHIKKPHDYIDDENSQISDAPIVIYAGGSELENGSAIFHQLRPHIILIHEISNKIPKGYNSFEHYVDEIDQLADSLPKAGSIIYNEGDTTALMIGKKEREDVKTLEYIDLKGKEISSGISIDFDGNTYEIKTENEDFLSHAAAAKILLKRVGVSELQFFTSLKAL